MRTNSSPPPFFSFSFSLFVIYTFLLDYISFIVDTRGEEIWRAEGRGSYVFMDVWDVWYGWMYVF